MNEFEIFSNINLTTSQPSPKHNFEGDNPRFPIWLSNSLQMTCHENNLVGLASPQVGIYTRAFYVIGFESAMFNPSIIDESEEQSYEEEASPSYPGWIVKIKRPNVIKVRWTNALGEVNTNIYNGLTSRTIQRKIDFLDGVDFRTRATKYHHDLARKGLKNERL